uniref:Uncharacterized protein n=1 Tax=Ixodes ricinus TaxID=34613 RepID=A0A6B0UQ45_IXORI
MQGGLSLLSLGLGMATCRRLRMPSTFLPFSLASMRWARSRSQASLRTSATPSSVTVLICSTGIDSSDSLANSSFLSGERSSGLTMSTLLTITKKGLLTNRGFMLNSSFICSSTVWPHCSERSMR